MAHVHAEEENTYYIDQLCTIGVCGALGGAAIMMYQQKMLSFLADTFHPWVLAGGIALLVLVVIRAVPLWFAVGRPRAEHQHPQDHFHDPDHAHDHGDCAGHEHHHEHAHDHGDGGGHEHDHHHDHSHADHGHEHGWSPWRYAVLLLPVVLYLMNMPSGGFSNDFLAHKLRGQEVASAGAMHMEQKGSDVIDLRFQELSAWAQNERTRKEYEGYVGKLRGQFWPTGNERAFTLVRFKMVCCATDAVPVNVLIVLANENETLSGIQELQWVEVEGQIQFRERPDHKGAFFPILQVPSRDHIRNIEADPSPFIQ